MAVIAVLAAVNYLGVKFGGNVQVAVTVIKVGLIAAIIVVGLGTGQGSAANYTTAIPAAGGVAGFFAALVGALWAYDGWNNVSMVSSGDPGAAARSSTSFDFRHLGGHRDLSC